MHKVTEGKSWRGLKDYDEYEMTAFERWGYTIAAAVVLGIAGYIFYHNIILSFLLCPLSFLYPKIRREQLIKKQKWELNIQFKDMLYYLSTALYAGKSVEGGFESVYKSLKGIFPDENAFIVKEVEIIIKKLQMNETIEESLRDFAQRSHLEDIKNFTDVFQTCKRTGGNLIEVIKNTSGMIRDKIEIRQEIENMIAGKKLEQKILTIAPVGMILFLTLSGGEFMRPVFTTYIGRIVMTIAILLIGIGYFISKKIMEIDV